MKAADRRPLVQVLRRIAQAHNVERVADTANRDKVLEMTTALRSAQLSAEDGQLLEETWEKYRASWPDWETAEGKEQDACDTEKFKFKAGQLTYNCTSGDWSSSAAAVLEALFLRLVAFVQTAIAPYGPRGISVTLERSTHSVEAHVHAHVYLQIGSGGNVLNPLVHFFSFRG